MKNVFYQVDSFRTHKTFEAWDQILSGGKSWHLSLFDETYNTVTWSQEPAESFDYLINKRIQHLSNSYKKIRLWYSAGRDSHFILRELIKRNINIDEIVFVDWAYHTPVKKEKHEVLRILANEFDNRAVPKINIFTPSRANYSKYWQFVSKQQQSGGIGSNYGFNLNSFGTLLDLFFETPDDTCNLFGLEKPRLILKNKNVIFQMVDSSIQHAMSPLHNIEWFFLQDVCPELVQKQIFMLINNVKIFAYTNNIKFNTALTLLQSDRKYYDLYCLFLGLGESVTDLTKYGGAKAFGLSNQTYHDLQLVGEVDRWDAPRYYDNFCLTAQDLISSYRNENQKNKLPGILSLERYICEIEEKLL